MNFSNFFKKPLKETLGMNDSLGIKKFTSDNKFLVTRAVVNDELEHRKDYNIDGSMEEKIIAKTPYMVRTEKEVAETFIDSINNMFGYRYSVPIKRPDKEMEGEDFFSDDTDRVNFPIKIQITTSGPEPHKNLNKKGIFIRRGYEQDIFNQRIEGMIDKKAKKDNYTKAIKAGLVLLLSGWSGDREEDINGYKNDPENQDFMKDAGFKEIWFVGHGRKTLIKLY